jgi:hypothetical protein
MSASARPAQRDPLHRRKIQLYERSQRDVGLWALLLGATAILGTAFVLRGEYRLVPERGAGYALGIVGLGAMVALLAYSLRKRLRVARRWGPVSSWFRVHMFLGIAGPVAILLHCNFRLGSTNANVALVSALTVSASGVAGRLLYGRIHAGLFGRRLSLIDLRTALAERKAMIETEASPDVLDVDAVRSFEQQSLASRGLLGSTTRLLALPFARARALRAATAAWRPEAPGRDEMVGQVEAYLDALARVSVFAACERLFALWHVVHLPLCVVLFLAAAVHVVAVHVY